MSVMRITGFADGFDSESMVTALMNVARSQQDRYNELAYNEELKLAAWNKVETSVGQLKSLSFQLTSYSTWGQMSATATNSAVLNATASSGASEGTYSVSVSKLAQSHRVGSDAQTSATVELGLAGTFTVGGQEVTVGIADSLETIRDAINQAALSMADEDAVRASIVDTTLVLTRKATGATEMALTDVTGDVLESLGILDATKAVKNELTAAQNLEAKVMGIDIVRSTNTKLTDVIGGVTLNLTAEGQSNFTIQHDRETVKSLILDFVDTYNATMESIEEQGKATVETDGGVTAATLQGDSLLRSIQSKSRSLLTADDTTGTLDSSLNSLRKLGIWTTSKENRLSVADSAALDDALADNFQGVEDLFRDYSGGIMRKFDDYLKSLTSAIDGTINRREQGIQDKVDGYDDKIAAMERSLTAYEEQLWNQFTAVETVIASFQQQSKYLTSLFEAQTSSDK